MWREQWQPVSKKTLWSPNEAVLQPWHQPFLLLGLHSNCRQLTHPRSRAWHQRRLAWTRQWVCVFSAMSYHAWLSLLRTLTQKSSCWSSGIVPSYRLPDAAEGKSQRLGAEEGAGVTQGTSCKIYSVPTVCSNPLQQKGRARNPYTQKKKKKSPQLLQRPSRQERTAPD